MNEARGDLEAALDCLERASAGGAPAAEVASLAASLGERARAPAMKERARALTLGRAPALALPEEPPPRRPSTVSPDELEVARSVLVTPDIVRALRAALAPAERPRDAGPTLPAETVLARLVTCDLDLAPLLGVALDLVLEATGATRGLIVARDEEGKLRRSIGRGLEERDLPPGFSSSILDEAERTGEPVFVADAVRDARFGDRASVHELRLRSVACVPIVDGRELLGAVFIDDPARPERFAREGGADAGTSILERRALLAALARALAVPLRNARRFEAQKVALERARAPVTPREARIAGRSKPVRELLEQLERAAPEEVPVLIEGESGTGKELAARLLHDLSGRAGPFVAENLAALPAPLVEAELFGVKKGAFTGADRDRDGLFVQARGGTIFLDEIGELALESQAKLLRVLQEKEVRALGGERTERVDARVVAATNRDLAALAREGRFREDLLYRLRVVSVRVPPLRERLEDLPLLCDHILERIARERGEPVLPLSRAALAKLTARPWPGNVRELENVLWRIALGGEAAIDAPVALSSPDDEPVAVSVSVRGEALSPLAEARLAFDRVYVNLALARCGGNVAAAARSLGMARPALWRLLKRLGIERG